MTKKTSKRTGKNSTKKRSSSTKEPRANGKNIQKYLESLKFQTENGFIVDIGFPDDIFRDGELDAIIKFGQSINFFSRVAELIPNKQSSEPVKHTIASMCSLMILGDIAGVHEYYNLECLQNDPVFKEIIASNPELIKKRSCKLPINMSYLKCYVEGLELEGRKTQNVNQLQNECNEILTDMYAESFQSAPDTLFLYLISTSIKLRNNQNKSYLLETIFSGFNPIAFQIISSTDQIKTNTTELFAKTLERLYYHFPEIEIICRAGSQTQNESTIKLFEELINQGHSIHYLFELDATPELLANFQEHTKRIKKYCQTNLCSKVEYVEQLIKSTDGKSQLQRVIAKIEYEGGMLLEKCDSHFVITNISQSEADPQYIHQSWNSGHAHIVDWINAFKIDIGDDKNNQSNSTSIKFRFWHLLLAIGLFELFRLNKMIGTKYEDATIAQIRSRIFQSE